MPFNVELDPKTMDANVLGEYLRELTFKKNGTEWSFGCYTTFEVNEGIEPTDISIAADLLTGPKHSGTMFDGLGKKGVPWVETDQECQERRQEIIDCGAQGYQFEHQGYLITCAWYWEGDGVLLYQISSGGEIIRTIENTDCKKNYDWRDVK